jgi:hypothetical protein
VAPQRYRHHQGAAFPHLLVQTFWAADILIGIWNFTWGSITQNLSTHILMWVDHLRAYKQLKMLLTAIFMASSMKWCKFSKHFFGIFYFQTPLHTNMIPLSIRCSHFLQHMALCWTIEKQGRLQEFGAPVRLAK